MTLTIEQLRRYAVARSLFRPTTLGRAVRGCINSLCVRGRIP